MATPLKNLLGDAVNRANITRGVIAARVVEEFDKVCRELYGEQTCSMISHVSFRDKKIRIKCSEAAAAQNLTVNRVRLVNEINRAFGQKVVEDLSVSIN